jgi:flagellar hook-associated protein 2
MSMSVDGLISGMDTTALITQLLQVEAAPQTALKSKLSAAQTSASAYRTVNTTFSAIRAAAEGLTSTSLTASRKATSNNANVTASAKTTAVDGSSLTFSVTNLASTQTLMSNSTWTSATAAVRSAAEPAWPIEIRDATGTTVIKSIDVPPGATLSEAAAEINKANAGVTAAVVRTGTNEYRLQFTSKTSGAAGSVMVVSATDTPATLGSQFLETNAGRDATIDLGGGLTATSSSNTFTDLIAGVSVTVSKADPGTPVTITVGQDAEAVATKMQALVDAVNAALSTVKTYTNNDKGSTAALKGEYAVTSLAGQLLGAVSSAVGADGSPAKVGLELTKDGKVTFDKATFSTALKETPALAQRMVGGQAAGNGDDGLAGTADDVVAVTGIAGRLLAVAKSASDSVTGSLIALAKGQDSIADDLQERIEGWDQRLARRKEALTRQFTAMETALSSLKNQSTWLAGQINALPSAG